MQTQYKSAQDNGGNGCGSVKKAVYKCSDIHEMYKKIPYGQLLFFGLYYPDLYNQKRC